MTNNVTGEEYTKQRFVAVLDIMGFKKTVESNQASVVYDQLKNIYDMEIVEIKNHGLNDAYHHLIHEMMPHHIFATCYLLKILLTAPELFIIKMHDGILCQR